MGSFVFLEITLDFRHDVTERKGLERFAITIRIYFSFSRKLARKSDGIFELTQSMLYLLSTQVHGSPFYSKLRARI